MQHVFTYLLSQYADMLDHSSWKWRVERNIQKQKDAEREIGYALNDPCLDAGHDIKM